MFICTSYRTTHKTNWEEQLYEDKDKKDYLLLDCPINLGANLTPTDFIIGVRSGTLCGPVSLCVLMDTGAYAETH